VRVGVVQVLAVALMAVEGIGQHIVRLVSVSDTVALGHQSQIVRAGTIARTLPTSLFVPPVIKTLRNQVSGGKRGGYYCPNLYAMGILCLALDAGFELGPHLSFPRMPFIADELLLLFSELFLSRLPIFFFLSISTYVLIAFFPESENSLN
jgi:hypothetical protein